MQQLQEGSIRLTAHLVPRLCLAVGLLAAASLGTVELAPALASRTGMSRPGYALVVITGLMLVVLTAAFLGYAGRLMGLGRAWLILTVIYNGLILTIKFILSPISLYQTTFTVCQPRAQGCNLFGSLTNPDVRNPNFLGSTAVFVFLLYALALLVIFMILRSVTRRRIGVRLDRTSVSTAIVILCLLIVAVPLGFGLLVLSSFFNFYLSPVFTLSGGILILLLLGALLSAVGAFNQASRQAVTMRSMAVLTAFFWVALSLLVFYHVLWVIYVAVLITIWPLKVFVPLPTNGK
jgi:hypothetical protein